MRDCKSEAKVHNWRVIWPVIKAGSALVQCTLCGTTGYKIYGKR